MEEGYLLVGAVAMHRGKRHLFSVVFALRWGCFWSFCADHSASASSAALLDQMGHRKSVAGRLDQGWLAGLRLMSPVFFRLGRAFREGGGETVVGWQTLGEHSLFGMGGSNQEYRERRGGDLSFLTADPLLVCLSACSILYHHNKHSTEYRVPSIDPSALPSASDLEPP